VHFSTALRRPKSSPPGASADCHNHARAALHESFHEFATQMLPCLREVGAPTGGQRQQRSCPRQRGARNTVWRICARTPPEIACDAAAPGPARRHSARALPRRRRLDADPQGARELPRQTTRGHGGSPRSSPRLPCYPIRHSHLGRRSPAPSTPRWARVGSRFSIDSQRALCQPSVAVKSEQGKMVPTWLAARYVDTLGGCSGVTGDEFLAQRTLHARSRRLEGPPAPAEGRRIQLLVLSSLDSCVLPRRGQGAKRARAD